MVEMQRCLRGLWGLGPVVWLACIACGGPEVVSSPAQPVEGGARTTARDDESDAQGPTVGEQSDSAFDATQGRSPDTAREPAGGPTKEPASASHPARSETANPSDAGGLAMHEAPNTSPPDAGIDAGMAPPARSHVDPGRAPFEPVPSEQVRDVCRLDPEALRAADALLGRPWAAVRYGRLCHAYQGDMPSTEVFSATKFLGTVVAGAVAYQTRALPRTGRQTGPFSDTDRADFWLDRVAYHRDAQVAHVLAMVAQSDSLAFGEREMEYDFFGNVQLDSLNFMLNAAVSQRGADLGDDLEGFTQRFVFEPLGMSASRWSFGLPNKSLGFGWETTILDMARLGLLVLRKGVWSGERVLSEEWTYRMTHPAFEDANTGMGYCTWLNARDNFHTGTMPTPPEWEDLTAAPRFPGPCAPVSIYREHPHGLSESLDCNYGPDHDCEQAYDVGVWQSFAGFGSVIQGHPGLDLLLVAFQLTPDDFFAAKSSGVLWDAVKPAVIAADPEFQGDEQAFCEAYSENRYAPDL